MTTIDGMVQEGPGAGPARSPGSVSPGGSRRALLVLDVVATTAAPPTFLVAAGAAVEAARERGERVIYIVRAHPGGAGAPAGGRAAAIHPLARWAPGDPVLQCTGSSAFSGNDLDALLRASDVDAVALIGSPLRDMVLSTAMAANDLGFRVAILTDGAAEGDPEVQQVLVERVLPRYGDVVGATVRRRRRRRRRQHSRRAQTTRRRPRPLVILAVVVVLAGAGWVAIDRGSHGYYEFSPGTAPLVTGNPACQERPARSGDLALPDGQPCVRLVVPANLAHTLAGSLFMVDVLVGPATPGQYLLNKLGLLGTFHDGMQLVPKDEVLGSTPASQLNCQDTQEMTGATEAASVVALRTLGYKVAEDDHGVLFDEVVPATPAAAAGLENTDLITAINAKPVLSASALTSALRALRPGQTVKVTVLRPTGPNCTLTSQLLTVTLGATPKEGTRPAEPNVAFLGIAGPTTNATYTLPLGVSVDVGDIGGPSAGLSLTLGLLDILSNGHLTGGHKVAATGTIDVNGNVGDVGGVAQKTVAVRRAGAVLFLVPPQEYQVALKEAGAHMKVEAVSTLQQALDDLRAIGGQIPSTTVRAATNG